MNLVVSLGPANVTVPDVVGQVQAARGRGDHRRESNGGDGDDGQQSDGAGGLGDQSGSSGRGECGSGDGGESGGLARASET